MRTEETRAVILIAMDGTVETKSGWNINCGRMLIESIKIFARGFEEELTILGNSVVYWDDLNPFPRDSLIRFIKESLEGYGGGPNDSVQLFERPNRGQYAPGPWIEYRWMWNGHRWQFIDTGELLRDIEGALNQPGSSEKDLTRKLNDIADILTKNRVGFALDDPEY